MPFDIITTLERVEGYLAASGRVPVHMIGEPKAPLETSKVAGAVWMTSMRVAELYLDGGTAESHVVTLALYRNMLAEPVKDIEVELAQAVSNISSDLLGDFDLGQTIREIDIAGHFGTGYGATWGYREVSGVMHRTVDITLPLVVDDSATAAA